MRFTRNWRSAFSEEQLIELAASAAPENFRARYNRLYDVGSDGVVSARGHVSKKVTHEKQLDEMAGLTAKWQVAPSRSLRTVLRKEDEG